jgi:hypothetical protein
MKTLTLFIVLVFVHSYGHSQAVTKPETMHFECRIQYKKEGELSHRAVTLAYIKSKLISVQIDAQPVYSFNVHSTNIITSVDSERIQIEFDKGKTLWRSNFRDRDFGNGLCIKRVLT